MRAPDYHGSFAMARALIGEIRRQKGHAKVSARWPVARLLVGASETDLLVVRAILDDVKTAGAIQEVEWEDSGRELTVEVHLADRASAT